MRRLLFIFQVIPLPLTDTDDDMHSTRPQRTSARRSRNPRYGDYEMESYNLDACIEGWNKDTTVKVKLYQCDECDKSFQTAPSLIRHKRLHTGIGLHQCPQCDKKFLEKRNLHAHINKHDGVKPFQCPRCLKCFSVLHYMNNASKHSCYKLHKQELDTAGAQQQRLQASRIRKRKV